ncbi:MAG: TetR family transcriptional regulator [Ilumatobacteraceae bacterium]|nr:TetR family transcriptional regulator [Ilumatobacteraceae bacterium]
MRTLVAFEPVKKQTVEERRNEILETTCEVVIERGFAGTRIADVAKRLSVSTSLIHYHYDSKEQLLAEAFSYYARKDLAALDHEIETAPTALAQLDRAIQNYVPEGSDDVEWMLWIDAWGEALRNPLMKKISQELDEQSVALLERVLTAGVTSGEFRCPNPASSALRLTGLIDGLAIQFAAHNDLLTRDGFIDHVRWLAAAEVGVDISAFDVTHVPPEPAARPLSVVTDLALRRLVTTYCDTVNRLDADGFMALWTNDANWDNGRTKPISGRANIGTAFTKAGKGCEWIVHVEPLAVFEIDEDAGEGSGRVTVQERIRFTDGSDASVLGTYHDRYIRGRTGWQFAERRLEIADAQPPVRA